jgi:hypothetical protein
MAGFALTLEGQDLPLERKLIAILLTDGWCGAQG